MEMGTTYRKNKRMVKNNQRMEILEKKLETRFGPNKGTGGCERQEGELHGV